jgi:hypothetical protein
LCDVNEDIRDYLRDHVPNPHGGTVGWIYIDYPRDDASFPRISVTEISGALMPAGLGEQVETADGHNTLGMFFVTEYDIDVWVGIDDRATFNSIVYTGTKLRDYLAEEVVTTLIEGKKDLREDSNIIDIEIENIFSLPLDTEYNLHRKTITIKVTTIWEKAT